MMNNTSGLFGGQLVVNGTRQERRGGGLYFGNQADTASSAADSSNSNKTKVQSSGQDSETQKKAVTQNFAASLLTRLTESGGADPENQTTQEEAQALVDSITAAVDELKKQFGQEAANKAMADILTATNDRPSSDLIAGAISGVLHELKASNQQTLDNSDPESEDYDKALKLEQRLNDFLEYLNAKSINQDGKDVAGLSEALGAYFGSASMGGNDKKTFQEDFTFQSAQSAPSAGTDAASPGFSLSAGEIGREVVQGLADYIRSEIGHEEAAAYIENLADSDDIFDAVDHVRNMFLANTTLTDGIITEPLNGDVELWNEGSKALAGMQSLPQRVGPGVDQLRKLSDYLEGSLVDEVNNAIRNDAAVDRRFQGFMTRYGDEGQKSGYGLLTWPRTQSVGGLQDMTYGPERRTWNTGNIGDTTSAERRINAYSMSAEFYASFADSHETYRALSEKSAAKHQELMAAYQKSKNSGEMVDNVV